MGWVGSRITHTSRLLVYPASNANPNNNPAAHLQLLRRLGHPPLGAPPKQRRRLGVLVPRQIGVGDVVAAAGGVGGGARPRDVGQRLAGAAAQGGGQLAQLLGVVHEGLFCGEEGSVGVG